MTLRRIRGWVMRIAGLFGSARRERELADEIEGHLEIHTDENIRLGLPPDEARRAAVLKFGSVESTKAAYRDRRGLPWIDTILQDVRYAVRAIRRTPAFSVVAIVTIALGAGINTAVFSVVNAVMLRPLPYPEPDRLVSVFQWQMERDVRFNVGPADLKVFRAQNRVFTDIAGFDLNGRTLTESGTPERLPTQIVTPNLFAVLGVLPAQGRTFRPEEDQPGHDRVVIISHELWQQRFGADPELLGKALRLDDERYEVIGIMPAGFKAPSQWQIDAPVAFYVTMSGTSYRLATFGDHMIDAVARLKPDATLAQAREDLARLARQIREVERDNRHIDARAALLQDDITRDLNTPLLVLLAAVAMVWLVACVNVANLFLVRAISRQREIAIRIGLGASRARVALGLMVFGLVVSAIGCAAGLVLGLVLKDVLLQLAPATVQRLQPIALDWRVLLVTTTLSLIAGGIFGLIPVWSVSRMAPGDVLKASERTLGGARVLRWRALLVAAEIGLSLILLVGSGLLLKSFVRLTAVDLGFQPEHVLAMELPLPQDRYPTPERRLQFFEAVAARVEGLPGVTSVAYANRMPLRGGWGGNVFVERPNVEDLSVMEVDLQVVSPGYFRTLGLTLVRGRTFAATDGTGAPPVIVVNERFVDRFLRGTDPIGRRVRRQSTPWMSVVGVVRDIRRGGKAADVTPQVYFMVGQIANDVRDFAVRAAIDPRSLVQAIQHEVSALDKDQPITNVKTLDQIISDGVAARRFQTILLFLFAAVALTLALVGTYGVMAYAVEQRTREIGVRVALGARPADVFRVVLGQGSRLIAAGALAGLAGAYALSRYLTTLLFSVEPTDPATFGTVIALLCATALAACYLPARRAMRISPTMALRHD